MFVNRQDAGQKLAVALQSYRNYKPLVIGLPRGGVVVAAEVALAFECDLDLLFVKKLGAPNNPELAIGAITEDGKPHLNQDVVRMLGLSQQYITGLAHKRQEEMAKQVRQYRVVKERINPAGRVCILIDDGLATGASIATAIQTLHAAAPASITVAVPGGPDDVLEKIRALPEVSEVVCLEVPGFFSGVSQLYEDFHQIGDREVIGLLREFNRTA